MRMDPIPFGELNRRWEVDITEAASDIDEVDVEFSQIQQEMMPLYVE